ncbi:MAG TPA: polyketide synthase, partial [Thermoleophilaceae bacterium]
MSRPRSDIAIVGVACRMPGAPDPARLWDLLREGREALTDAPPERAGTAVPRGGFIEHVEEFDPDFFGMSPREAVASDPQQRLALELSWEGLEDAGIAVADAAAGPVGVFLGVMAADYADLVVAEGEDAVGRHTLTGLGRSIVANRVSHSFGLTGPSMTVDTGQSSSLVSVHLACESLRGGESALALAGGVNLVLSPLGSRQAAEFGALSPDGRCYVFDSRANGYVRGEGGGVVVLKRLDDARRDGDRVYGVIRGSAVGSGTDAGLTVPSAEAQERVVREALAQAGVEPGEVRYVELHGTGTPVGDPVEAAALGAVFGDGREEPLAVGSVKTNIGHLEGAAGVAGLIKAALCVQRRELVPSLNFEEPHPDIPLGELGLRVVGEAERLGDGPVVAG